MSESLFCFVALFMLAVFLVQTHLYEERAEQPDADAEGDDEPEINAHCFYARQPIDTCAQADAE